MGERLVILLRHGEAKYDPALNDENGSPDGPLSDRGHRQAELAGRRLADREITTLHHSMLERAAQTARVVREQIPDLPMHGTDLLRECIPSVPPDDRMTADQRTFFAGWPGRVLISGAARARALLATFTSITDDDRVDLLVTHGNVIAWFVCQALGAPAWAWVNLPTHACGALSAIAYREGRAPILLAYNDAGHLPAELRASDTQLGWRL
jgi:serine/threonine-protein phosphatase PGAM5